MSQARLSNVSATQSGKLSPRLLKSSPTMTTKQPAVFLTRYVWSRNRPVCSLRESPSSSSKFPPSEKIRTGSLIERKPSQKSSSVSMRPPGVPVWPPRSLRWPKRWDSSLASNAPLTVTSKCQPTACSEMWLPVSVTTFSTPTVQTPTHSQNQVVLSSAQITGAPQAEMLSKGSHGTSVSSVKLYTASYSKPVTSGATFASCGKPTACGNTSKNFAVNPEVRNSSSKTVRKSTTGLGQSQQSMRWPPRSVKWPNRRNKFSQLSSDSSARSTDSTSMASDTKLTVRPLMPKQVTSTQISRPPPRVQGNSVQHQVLESLPTKTTSVSKNMESSLESSADSSPLSERSSQWTDSLETSGISPTRSTQSSSASVSSPTELAMSLPVLKEQLAGAVSRSKEPRKSETKSAAQKCTPRSTNSSVSSSQTPEKSHSSSIRSTGQSVKLRKLQGQPPLRPAVSLSAKRLEWKRSEFSKSPAVDTSSSIESTPKSLSPTPPFSSTRFLKLDVKLTRSATWPTELKLQTKRTHLLPEYLTKKDSEPPSTSQRMLYKHLRQSSSVGAISLPKKSPANWERKRAPDVPLFSPIIEPFVSEHRFTQSSDSSTRLENSSILPEPSEMTERLPSSSSKCVSGLEVVRTPLSPPTLQRHSAVLTSPSTMPPSLNGTSPSVVSSNLVKMTTASLSGSQISTKEIKEPTENAPVLLVWPNKSLPTPRTPGVTPTATQGGSWNFRRSSERSQVWPQMQSTAVKSVPVLAVSPETIRSQATVSAGAAILGTAPEHTGVRPVDFPLSSFESSKLWPSRGISVDRLPRYSPSRLTSSVTQLSLSAEQPPVSQETEKTPPSMLKKSSPVPQSLPSGILPLSESSSVRVLKRNTRAMMAPTLSTKFQSRSVFFESSSEIQLAHTSISPSWPSLPPHTHSMMTSLGQYDRRQTEATSCLMEHKPCASHLAVTGAQNGFYTQSRNPSFSVPSTVLQAPKMSSQPIHAESEEIPQRSLAPSSRQSSLSLTPHSPSFQPTSFLSPMTIVHTTASFPVVYSPSPSVSCCVTQTQSSAGWICGNLEKPVTSQVPICSTSHSRHTPIAPSGSVTVQTVPSASLCKNMTDKSEAVPGVSRGARPLVPQSMWTHQLEIPRSSSRRKSPPPCSEPNVVSWASNTCPNQPVASGNMHSQFSSCASDSFPVSSVTYTSASARLPAPSWSAAASVFPPITGTTTEPKLPMFDWISSGPLWMPVQLASPLCTSSTVHLMTSAPALAATRSPATWAASTPQLPTTVPSSKGPVVSAVVQTPIPQSEPAVSWSRSRPAAWSSTTSSSATGVSGFQKEPSSGLVRLPIKYIKRRPLPRTSDIDSSSSTR